VARGALARGAGGGEAGSSGGAADASEEALQQQCKYNRCSRSRCTEPQLPESQMHLLQQMQWQQMQNSFTLRRNSCTCNHRTSCSCHAVAKPPSPCENPRRAVSVTSRTGRWLPPGRRRSRVTTQAATPGGRGLRRQLGRRTRPLLDRHQAEAGGAARGAAGAAQRIRAAAQRKRIAQPRRAGVLEGLGLADSALSRGRKAKQGSGEEGARLEAPGEPRVRS